MARLCKEEKKEHRSSFDEYLCFDLTLGRIGFSKLIVMLSIITITIKGS